MRARALVPFAVSLASVVVSCASTETLAALAQQAAASPHAEGGSVDKSDKSGTNPLNLQNTFVLFNEFQDLESGDFRNLTNLRYIQAFAGGTMNFRTTVPFVATDVGAPGDAVGLGDLNFRYNWIPHLTHQTGVLVGAELNADSASDDRLGRGKWSLAPVVTTAFFFPSGLIFAPSYQQNVSFAGDDGRSDINEGYIDLYVVKTAKDKRSWFLLDPTIVLDYEDDLDGTTVELEIGRVIGPVLHAAGSFYVRPGIGIGNHRAYDWNIEVGFKVVGL
jgi:hypothetical protein